MKVIPVTCTVMPKIEGYHYCMPLETLLALNFNSFILTLELLVLILMLEICMVTVIVKVHVHCWKYQCVLLEIPSMHKLVQYLQSLYTYRYEDIYELKGVPIANFEADHCSSSVEYCNVSNVNSLYLCSCKQCCYSSLFM